MFENKVLGDVSRSKLSQVRNRRGKVHNERLHDFHWLLNIIRMIK